MADVRVIQRAQLNRILLDWALTPTAQLDDTHQLETAVIISIATDRLALEDDVLPDPRSDDRRGWWGDTDADTLWGGGAIGSRHWLLERAKITDSGARTGATTTLVEGYVREAVQWLLDSGVASRMAVSATRTGVNAISATVTLYRGPKVAVALQFQDLWTDIRA